VCSRFKKTYRDEAEKVRRLLIFKDTYKRVAGWNRGRDTSDPGWTLLSDLLENGFK
jgi:hypothetical protein